MGFISLIYSNIGKFGFVIGHKNLTMNAKKQLLSSILGRKAIVSRQFSISQEAPSLSYLYSLVFDNA